MIRLERDLTPCGARGPTGRRELGNVEIVREGDTLIMRRSVDPVKFRKIAAKVLANMPKPKKGESIVRELNEVAATLLKRLRAGRLAQGKFDDALRLFAELPIEDRLERLHRRPHRREGAAFPAGAAFMRPADPGAELARLFARRRR